MSDTAFQNLDDSAIEAARNAELEAYRQRLIAYDNDPQPRSPDLTELADVDANDDGYTWNSVTGRWESEGGGNGEETGTLLSPVIHDPVKWYWGGRGDTQITGQGLTSDGYDDSGVGVITNSQLVVVDDQPVPQPMNGAIPDPVVIGADTVTLGVPVGSADAVTAGILVGDRVFYDDSFYFGHQGIYVITDLGSPSSPWVLTRADDHPIADLLLAFYVEVEDTGIIIQTRATETNDAWLYMAVAGPHALANAPGAFAGGVESMALGVGAAATGRNSIAVGHVATAVGDNASAIGASAHAITNSTSINNLRNTFFGIQVAEDGVIDMNGGGGFADIWIEDDITFSLLGAGNGYFELSMRIVNSGEETIALTFPVIWKWRTEMPVDLEANRKGLCTVLGWVDEFYASYEVLPE